MKTTLEEIEVKQAILDYIEKMGLVNQNVYDINISDINIDVDEEYQVAHSFKPRLKPLFIKGQE